MDWFGKDFLPLLRLTFANMQMIYREHERQADSNYCHIICYLDYVTRTFITPLTQIYLLITSEHVGQQVADLSRNCICCQVQMT